MKSTNLILRDYLCSECGGLLVEYWNGKKLQIGCGKSHSHKGFRRADYKLEVLLVRRGEAISKGLPTDEIDALIQDYQIKKQEVGMITGTSLGRYEGQTNLSEKEAAHILETCWPNAPKQEVMKAALLCKSYGLNPLMKHIFLIPFKTKGGGTDWATVMGIKATRLLASRRKSFTYTDGPRVMTEEEQKTIFGKIDFDRTWAICVVGDLAGNRAPGYGFWPVNSEPYGTDKGNSSVNMAFIRAERNALDRLLPGEMPDVEVIDERYQPGNEQPPIIVESITKPEAVAPLEPLENGERASLEQELISILQGKPPTGFGWLEPTALKYIGIPHMESLPTIPMDTLKLTLAKAKTLLADAKVGRTGKLL